MSAPLVIHASGICAHGCDHHEPAVEQVEACRSWLRLWARPRKTINWRLSSYQLKHAVEHASRRHGVVYELVDSRGRSWTSSYLYVSNGAFIAAALLEGYRAKQIDDSLNARLNLAMRPALDVAVGSALARAGMRLP